MNPINLERMWIEHQQSDEQKTLNSLISKAPWLEKEFIALTEAAFRQGYEDGQQRSKEVSQ